MTCLPGDSDIGGPAGAPQPPAPSQGPAQLPDDEGIMCARCGTRAEVAPLTWTCSVENGTRSYFCDACARTHLRAIEGRLDSAWW
ncbi:hypothetical protein [Streptomyces himalayensis]|uniref:hypothetical protein n=1 Tax=Streptomyces himalayensis TaxID=2820085 RepID=UPI001C69B560|nr:hypothetical protein [Streptomyces himalayensis]